jgi:hypothetical protein
MNKAKTNATASPVAARAQEIAAQTKADADARSEREAMEAATQAAQAEADESARLARLKEIKQLAKKELDRSELDAARDEMAQSLERYVSLCAAYNQRHSALIGEVTSSPLMPLLEGWETPGYRSQTLRIEDAEYNRARPIAEISAAAMKPLKEASTGGFISLDTPNDV